MPKPQTFPTLYNDVLQLNISKLKEWKYLIPEQIKFGTISWSSNGNETGSISVKVNTLAKQPYIELSYKYRGESRNYKIEIVFFSSNLGKGFIWYFLCPQTKKRCRKLYLIGGYFLHREAFKNGMYESQTWSKKYRELDKTLGTYFKSDDLYGKLYSKHFKKSYAGKPTKRYMRIMQQINKAESLSNSDIELLMLK